MKKNISYIQNNVAKFIGKAYEELGVPLEKQTLATLLNEKQEGYDVGFINEEGDIFNLSNREEFRNRTKEDFDRDIERQIKSAIVSLIK